MPDFEAQHLARWTGGRWTTQPAGPIVGFCVDSRQLRPGQVFVALKTEKRDGHDFLPAAAAAGAIAAIVAVPSAAVALPQLVVADPLVAFQAIAREHRLAFAGRVVGISGSAGKTSTKELLAILLGGTGSGVPAAEGNEVQGSAEAVHGSPFAVARSGEVHGGEGATSDRTNSAPAAAEPSCECGPAFTGRVLATEANLNNHLGVPLTLTRIDSAAHDFAVVEAGISAPGDMQPLADMIAPDVSIITLIAPAHTEELGGLEGVAREKAQLPAKTRALGVAVFSRETAGYAAFRELGVRAMIIERADVLRPAEPPRDTVYYTLTQRADETAVALAYGAPPPRVFTLRRVTDGMAQNAVLAICTALWLGIAPELIQARLREWQPASLRGEIRRDDGRLVYLDCYNANPASMADALTAFDAVAPADAPRLYVLGSMEELGAEAAAYHRALGRSLPLRPDDEVFVVGTQAAAVRDGALEAHGAGARVHVIDAAAAVSETVRAWRGPIFVKGSRRYRLEQVLGAGANGVAAPH